MANPEYDPDYGFDYDASYPDAPYPEGAPAGGAVSATMGWIGAALSVALLIGLGWWSYDLATRDARDVPVVAALAGPARVAPETPGGFQAAHQGLAVTSVSEREADPAADEVQLAPEPTALAAEDMPIPAMRPELRQQGIRDAVNSALQDAGITGAAQPASASGNEGVPRPRPRPEAEVVSRAVAQPAPIAPIRASLDLDPTTIPAGTRLVQLGAYDSADLARAEWAQAEARFGSFLADKQRVIEPTNQGGKTLYRLRAHGFADLPEARRFCAAFTAEGVDCIPVLVR